MTKKLIWRLKEQPSAESLRDLVNTGILTKEEAREILVSTETTEDRDKKSLESEIKFLRELVAKLSENRNTIVETIRYIEKPYYKYPWYQPYVYWCASGTQDLSAGTPTYTVGSNSNLMTVNTLASTDFTNIKTF